MYKLKISGYILMLLLSTPHVALAGRTGYIAANPCMDVMNIIIGIIFVYLSLRHILKSLNPKEDMDLATRFGGFIFCTLVALFCLFIMSVSSDALGITHIHLLRSIF